MDIYDIAVVGGGAAGTMAAIRAGQLKKNTVLIERNDSLGKKILLTGKGRCNITNTASIDIFIDKFGKQGRFLRSALFNFFNEDLMEFFKNLGLEMKAERQGRVFPVTDKAFSVTEVLKKSLAENGVKAMYDRRLTGIRREGASFKLELSGGDKIYARKVILATGGASYKATGSTGDGFRIAEKLGHRVVPLKPALVPLVTKEKWVKDLQGLSLENVRLTFECGRKKVVSDIGELVFTHFGVSGPLVLDLSGQIVAGLENNKEIRLLMDLKPSLTIEEIEKRLIKEFEAKGSAQIKNIMKNLLPNRLIPIVMRLSGADPDKKANQVVQGSRRAIANLLKALPLTVTGSLPVEEAMVTSGGIPTEEIDPRTMESRVVPGLYFAGEMIDGCAPSGGYNLQKAFSTGYLAGEKAAGA